MVTHNVNKNILKLNMIYNVASIRKKIFIINKFIKNIFVIFISKKKLPYCIFFNLFLK